MFWYLKFLGSIEWSILLNKTSLCSKTWLVGPEFFLFNTKNNYEGLALWFGGWGYDSKQVEDFLKGGLHLSA